MTGLPVTNMVNKIKIKGTWGELEANNCFQRQSFTKSLRLILAFM